jgi:hypothetical protein
MTKILHPYANSARVTPEDFEDLAAGRAVMESGGRGRTKTLRLTPKDQPLFEEAKACGWLVLPQKNERLCDLWFYFCESQGKPFVYTRPLGRFTEVRMDCITCDYRVDNQELHSAVIDLCLEYQQERSGYSGTFSQIFVLPEDAPAVAEKLLRLADTCRFPEETP